MTDTQPAAREGAISYEPEIGDGYADPGEVVWGWVPYEDDETQGKDRPVLVIGQRAGVANRCLRAKGSCPIEGVERREEQGQQERRQREAETIRPLRHPVPKKAHRSRHAFPLQPGARRAAGTGHTNHRLAILSRTIGSQPDNAVQP